MKIFFWMFLFWKLFSTCHEQALKLHQSDFPQTREKLFLLTYINNFPILSNQKFPFLLFIWFASLYTKTKVLIVNSRIFTIWERARSNYIHLLHPRICTTSTKMIIVSWEKLSNLAHIRSIWQPFFTWDKNILKKDSDFELR